MAAKSPTFLERLSLSRNDSPVLPLYNLARKKPSEYDLAELSPREEQDALLSPELPQALAGKTNTRRSPPPAGAEDLTRLPSPPVRGPNSKRRVMFAGPPPPIAGSTALPKSPTPHATISRPRNASESVYERAASPVAFGSLLLGRGGSSYPKEQATLNPDSVWRNLQRREKSIEKELQDLINMQAEGLLAGGGGTLDSASTSERDTLSDTGSSTPTGTFYSTATSKSRMIASIEQPARSTPRGDIIPVRQPKPKRSQGLRAARRGLRRSMAALAELKAEENAHITLALSQRKKALSHVRRLVKRHDELASELQAFEEDDSEPLGKELRDLDSEHRDLSREIKELEEKLVGMRNRRRWLEQRMDNVQNRREAGLSGYRGALKEVDDDVLALMRRPPVKPLDPLILRQADSRNGAVSEPPLGGNEFLRLIPERRTMDMAKQWWEGEVCVLESRKARVNIDREALEQGAVLWEETTKLVTDFEADLRKLVQGDPSAKGKGKAPTQEDIMRTQLLRMGTVVMQLEERLRIADTKGWNLLICAIGAELEAFKEAEHLLQETLMSLEPEESIGTEIEEKGESKLADMDNGGDVTEENHDESDNEVPADLLISHVEEDANRRSSKEAGSAPALERIESETSENEVPPEFLREHSLESDGVD